MKQKKGGRVGGVGGEVEEKMDCSVLIVGNEVKLSVERKLKKCKKKIIETNGKICK